MRVRPRLLLAGCLNMEAYAIAIREFVVCGEKDSSPPIPIDACRQIYAGMRLNKGLPFLLPPGNRAMYFLPISSVLDQRSDCTARFNSSMRVPSLLTKSAITGWKLAQAE